jgi:hypothetical protein
MAIRRIPSHTAGMLAPRHLPRGGSGVSMRDKTTKDRRGGARAGSGRRKQWTNEKLRQLLFDFEAQRRSTRVKFSDSQLCVRLTEKLAYRGLSAGTIRRKLQDSRIWRKLQDARPGRNGYRTHTSIVDLINTLFASEGPQAATV